MYTSSETGAATEMRDLAALVIQEHAMACDASELSALIDELLLYGTRYPEVKQQYEYITDHTKQLDTEIRDISLSGDELIVVYLAVYRRWRALGGSQTHKASMLCQYAICEVAQAPICVGNKRYSFVRVDQFTLRLDYMATDSCRDVIKAAARSFRKLAGNGFKQQLAEQVSEQWHRACFEPCAEEPYCDFPDSEEALLKRESHRRSLRYTKHLTQLLKDAAQAIEAANAEVLSQCSCR